MIHYVPIRAQPQRLLLRVLALPSSALSSSGLAPRAEGLQAPRRTAETDGNTLPLLVPIPRGSERKTDTLLLAPNVFS